MRPDDCVYCDMAKHATCPGMGLGLKGSRLGLGFQSGLGRVGVYSCQSAGRSAADPAGDPGLGLGLRKDALRTASGARRDRGARG